ncbi:MAG: hypothetical protein ACP5MH_10570, partial [Thermoproteus sp.]
VAGLSTLVTLPKQIGQLNLSYSSQAAAYTSLPTSGVDIHSAAPVMSFMSYSDYCASTGQCAGIPAYNYHDQSWSSQTVQPAAYLGIYSGTRASSLPAVRASSELPGMVLQGIERSEFLDKIEEALLKAAPSAADVDKVVADTVPTKTGYIRKVFAFLGGKAVAALGTLKDVLAKAATKGGRFVADLFSKTPGWVKLVSVLLASAAALDTANNLIKNMNASTALNQCSIYTQSCAALASSYASCVKAGGQDCSNIANSPFAQLCRACGYVIEAGVGGGQQQPTQGVDIAGLIELVAVSAIFVAIAQLMKR